MKPLNHRFAACKAVVLLLEDSLMYPLGDICPQKTHKMY